jgi:putative hemolysin
MGEEIFPGGLQLPNANAQIYASTHNAEIFNCFAEGGDY